MRCCCSRHCGLDDSSSLCPFGPVSVFIHYRLARAIASSLKPCEHLRYTPQSRLLEIPVYSEDSSFAGISGYWLALVKDVADLPLNFGERGLAGSHLVIQPVALTTLQGLVSGLF